MKCGTLQTHGHDKYTRTIADVFLPDGTNVNHTLVKGGWCWWYRKYTTGNVMLEELERRARASGLGLWADPHPCRRGFIAKGDEGQSPTSSPRLSGPGEHPVPRLTMDAGQQPRTGHYCDTSLSVFVRARWSLMNHWSQVGSPSMLPLAPAENPLGVAPTVHPALAGGCVTSHGVV
jgi:nuclease-like protein